MYHFSNSNYLLQIHPVAFQFVSTFRVLTKPISLNVWDLILLRSNFVSHGYVKDSFFNAGFFYGVC